MNILKRSLLRSAVAFCLVVGLHLLQSSAPLFAQTPSATPPVGQVLVDEISSENTTIIEMLAVCLPPHRSFAASTHYALLDKAELTGADGKPSQFYYLNVSYRSADGDLLDASFQSLLEVNSNSECIAHIQFPTVTPVSDYVPFEVAVQFARRYYSFLQEHRPEQYQGTIDYLRAGGLTAGQAFQPGDDVAGCQVLRADHQALQEMGVMVAPNCTVVDHFSYGREGQ